MIKIKNFKTALFLGIFIFFISVSFVGASETNGIIDSIYKYAWSENIGWINFGCNNCNVSITDSVVTGYAWSENYGWINLNPSGSGVKNNGEGSLSGQAWGENTGWINFSGVSIDSSGYFSGYATGDVTGRISFNCSNTNSCSASDFKVRTDWRPDSVNNQYSDKQEGAVGSALIPMNSIGAGIVSTSIGIEKVKGGYIIDTKGVNFLAHIRSQINFKVKGSVSEHSAKIVDLDMMSGKINIKFNKDDTKTISLFPKKSAQVDLDGDGKKDIKVIYNELKLNTIDITFVKLEKNFYKAKSKFSDGKLVKEFNESMVYLIEDGKKRPILNEETFKAYGFSWSDIIETDNLDDYATGEALYTTVQKKQKPSYQFKRNLKIGDRGADVKKLQEFLNQNGFNVANSGPGSLGNETDFFGGLTAKALEKFQKYYKDEILIPLNLSFPTGVFGPQSRKVANSIFSGDKTTFKKASLNIEDKDAKQKSKVTFKNVLFTRTLSVGMRGDDVKKLQELLNSDKDTMIASEGPGSKGKETNYFGRLTSDAVKRFQKKHNIITPENEDFNVYGLVGPKTRAKLQELFGG